MSTKSAALRNEVLSLPTHERAGLAVELLASLDDQVSEVVPVEIDRAWGEEMVRRSERIVSGEAKTLTWDEVREKVVENRRTVLNRRVPVGGFPWAVCVDF